MTLLHHQSRLKKSEISSAGKMAYDKCRKYLEWMEMMDLIDREVNQDGFEVILLTEKAHILYNKKFKDSKS